MYSYTHGLDYKRLRFSAKAHLIPGTSSGSARWGILNYNGLGTPLFKTISISSRVPGDISDTLNVSGTGTLVSGSTYQVFYETSCLSSGSAHLLHGVVISSPQILTETDPTSTIVDNLYVTNNIYTDTAGTSPGSGAIFFGQGALHYITYQYNEALGIGNSFIFSDRIDMFGQIRMQTNKITGLGTPTADADAATKLYVDTAAAGGGTLQSVTNTGNTTTNALLVSASGSTFQTLTTTQKILAGGEIEGRGDIKAGDNLYVNYDGPNADSFVYFWEDSSPTAASIMFDNDPSGFVLSHKLTVPTSGSAFKTLLTTGNVVVGGDLKIKGSNLLLDYDGTSGAHSIVFGNGSTHYLSYSVAGGGFFLTDTLDLASKKITALATPTASTDAANKSYVDSFIRTNGIPLINPTSGSYPILSLPFATTITQVRGMIRGTSPSCTFNLRHATSFGGSSSHTFTQARTLNSTNTLQLLPINNDATVTSGSTLYLDLYTTSGTVTSLDISFDYKRT